MRKPAKKKYRICMIVQDPRTKGGMASVTSGYRGSRLERDLDVTFVENYCDGSKGKKLLKACAGLTHFLWVLAVRRPDLVHLHSSFGPDFYRSIPFVGAAAVFRVPVVNHIHGSEFDRLYTDASPVKRALIRRVWGLCARLIVLTDAWKDRLSAAADPARIRVVANYAPQVPDVRGMHRRSPKHRVLFLGLLNRAKGAYDMIDIAARVRETVPDAVFILAGSGDVKTLRALAKEKGVGDGVFFPGWVRDAGKEKLLAKSAVFLLPSYTEAMPMSVLEAMAYGLPVVATDVGGIPSLVAEGENGFLYTPGDTAGMAEGLRRLLTEEELRERFSARSLAFIRERFSLEKHIDALEALYAEVLAYK